jgi:hypothetical protein
LLPPNHPKLPIIEPAVECSADNPVVPGNGDQSFKMLLPQLGIRMVKAQEGTACLFRTGVQLHPSRRGIASNQMDCTQISQFPHCFPGFDRNNNPFGSRRLDRHLAPELGGEVVITPDEGTIRLTGGCITDHLGRTQSYIQWNKVPTSIFG